VKKCKKVFTNEGDKRIIQNVTSNQIKGGQHETQNDRRRYWRMKRTKTLDALLGRRVSVTIRKSFPWKKGTVTGKLIWRNGYNIDTGFHLVKVDPEEIEEVKEL
jgi:hypothetical protein